MNTILFSVLGFILAIGVLTTIHEFGHFWVARSLGVKVLRFSIGFGKALFKWRGKTGTEYVIAAIPLGGYVRMLDQNETTVTKEQLHLAYNTKPVWARMLIIIAGPAFNIIFAILAYWVVFMLGLTSLAPIIGDVPKDSPAYNAGLSLGKEIIAIDNRNTATWEDIAMALVSQLGDKKNITITVRNLQTQQISQHVLTFSSATNQSDPNILKNLGLEPYDPLEPVVSNVMPDMPAATAGLLPGDRIVSIDGVAVKNRSQILHLLSDKYDVTLPIVVARGQQQIELMITPMQKVQNGVTIGFVGMQFDATKFPEHLFKVQRYTPLIALHKALTKTKEYSILTLQFVGKMLSGKMSTQHVAGPITIAKFAGSTVSAGIEYFLSFLALISISLGVLNMLPIPILDGGHFLFCVVELIRGKPLSQQFMSHAQIVGATLLGAFMFLALYNDFINF